MRTRIKNIAFSVLIISILALSGCIAGENDSTASSRLIIETILGLDLDGSTDSTIAFVDVYDSETGVTNSPGKVIVTASLMDPTVEPTFYQDITVDQIDIEYSRTDGQSIQGVDVPYSFSQYFSVLVPIGTRIEIPVNLVNHDAKMEPPLIGLYNLGQNKILKLEAKLTIHGKDQAGNRILPVSGKISLWCADFGND